MPRRKKVQRREVAPDAKYGSELVAEFISCVMRQGKKSLAERLVYGAFDIIERKSGQPCITVFKQALANVKPVLEVKSRRVGGATYQVPVEVRPRRRTALGIRWLISFARQRHEHTMEEKLANELLDAYRKEGRAYKKREDTHRMAEANRAFAHYRW
jgi:small subunit ribosomal protein S7